MHLIQLLLPLYDNEGRRFPRSDYDAVRAALVEAFGGVTAYVRAPAAGLWQDEQAADAGLVHDDVVLFEVMVETLDRAWWAQTRQALAARFRQDELVVRALAIEML